MPYPCVPWSLGSLTTHSTVLGTDTYLSPVAADDRDTSPQIPKSPIVPEVWTALLVAARDFRRVGLDRIGLDHALDLVGARGQE